MRSEQEATIARQEYGYGNISAIAVTAAGKLLTADSLEDLPITPDTRIIKNPPVEHAFSAPIKAYFDPTKICPLGCDHCLANIPAIKSGHMHVPSMKPEQVKQVSREIIETGILETKLSGGEPFVYKPFWDAVETLGEAGVSVSTSTSGVTLSNEKLLPQSEIDLLAKHNVKISLSVDGESDYHDRLRKKAGLLQDVLSAGIERLLGHGISRSKLEFRSTILHTEDSFAQLDYLDQLARQFQLKTRIRLARPAGAATLNDVAVIQRDDLTFQIMRKLRKMSQENRFINVEEIIKYDEPAAMRSGLDCGAGTRSIYVNPEGELSACIFLDKFFTQSHNLFTDGRPMLEIWQSGEAFMAIRQYYEAQNAESTCAKCNFVHACQGGCPAVKLSLNMAVSPLCPKEII